MLPRERLDRIEIAFDDHRLVANAGLILPVTLAHHLGLGELVDSHVDLGATPGRVNAGHKMLTLVASALAGGDCIDDADALRAGETATATCCVIRAPTTSIRQSPEVPHQALDLITGLARRISTHRFLRTVPQPADRGQKSSQPYRYATRIALSDKHETKQYCNLTREQVTLYEAVLRDVETRLEDAEGMARRGSILDTLVKLKQVCNHPRQLLGDNSSIAGRSGKLARLEELLDEIVPAGDRVLVFSQFAEMGAIIQQHVQETYGIETPMLHGGVSRKNHDQMVERFQNDPNGPQVFVLSLKAGGSGLNLPRANHVIHYDRWWNPAVENQATDRAFRIGQTKDVHVHKMICAGTLEDRIDAMIEAKQQTADQVVGATSERWLTELSNTELREVLSLSATPAD